MSGRLYTDETGALRVAADGSIHTDDCQPPPCCDEGDYLKATNCDLPSFVIYIRKDALCTNVTGSVNHEGTAIQWAGECFLVDVTTTYALEDIPGGSIVLEDATWPCEREGCEGELCAQQYVEMLNCGPSTPTDSQRVFVPLERYNQWITASQDQVHGHPCCNVWKINGRCVTRPNISTLTASPPGSSFIAEGHPDDYAPQYNSCCDCNDSCQEQTYTIESLDTPHYPDIVLNNCPSNSFNVLTHDHSISYSRFESRRNEVYSEPTSDVTTVLFEGTAAGTVRWRSNVAAAGPITHAISYTGDCEPAVSGGSGVETPTWVPSATSSVFGKRNPTNTGNWLASVPGMVSLSMVHDDFPVPSNLHMRPSASYHGTLQLPRTGSTSLFYTATLDLEWTASYIAACEYYAYTAFCDFTYVRDGHFGDWGADHVTRTTYRTTLSMTVTGRIFCGSGTNAPCCQCLEEDSGPGALMAGGAMPEARSPLARLTRASGASKISRMTRK